MLDVGSELFVAKDGVPATDRAREEQDSRGCQARNAFVLANVLPDDPFKTHRR